MKQVPTADSEEVVAGGGGVEDEGEGRHWPNFHFLDGCWCCCLRRKKSGMGKCWDRNIDGPSDAGSQGAGGSTDVESQRRLSGPCVIVLSQTGHRVTLSAGKGRRGGRGWAEAGPWAGAVQPIVNC